MEVEFHFQLLKLWTQNKKYFFDLFNFQYLNIGDDVMTDFFRHYLDLDPKNMHTNLFYGFPISDETEEILLDKHWNLFTKCPEPQLNFTDRAFVRDNAVWRYS
jgi:hypothetical protein